MLAATVKRLIGRSAANRVHQRYSLWRRESTAVRSAYARWASSDCATEHLAYVGYLAALEQEALAAERYREELAQLARFEVAGS